jgi:CheY-like chemotaxis protein
MPKKILLADDSITIQKVVELTFSDGDYEVTAVNNGAKAIQKLGEMRPDIILSDIIMPEKNGYEVCEFVKSHPDFRKIPVVLLTGTFEPFDPDRADKAGCDAVVTKPFESQSLIAKVEELIAVRRAGEAAEASAAAASPAATPQPAGFSTTAFAPGFGGDDPFAPPPAAPEPPTPAPSADPFGGFAANNNDIFAAPPVPPVTTDMPFDAPPEPAFGGETRAFPRMSFEEMQQMAGQSGAIPAAPEAPAAAEPSPWDTPEESPAPFGGGETRAFPAMSFDETPQAPEPFQSAAPSPWDEPAEPAAFGGETRAFPRMSFEEMQKMAEAATPAASTESHEAAADQTPFGVESAADAGNAAPEAPLETRAFRSMSFDDMPPMASPASPAADEHAADVHVTPEPSPWDAPEETPAFGGETRAFPAMSFADLQQMAPTPEPEAEPELPPMESSPWDETHDTPRASAAAVPEAPAAPETFATSASFATPDTFAAPDNFAPDSFATSAISPFGEPIEEPAADESPFGAEPQMHEEEAPEPAIAAPTHSISAAEQPMWSPSEAETPAAISAAPAAAAAEHVSGELTEEQIDRIARRVVQLMSEQVVRNIAWEVIPDLAEIVVKERIRQLESEA